MDALAQKGAELHKERLGLKAFRDEHTKDGVLDFTAEDRERADKWLKKIGELNDEVKKLGEDKAVSDELDAGIKAWRQPAGSGMTFPTDQERERGMEQPKGTKSLGELFIESDAYKQWRPGMKAAGPAVIFDLEKQYGKRAASLGLKALFDTASYAPQPMRLPTPILQEFQPLTIADLFPQGRTNTNAIPFMRETTAVNAAAGVAEGGEKLPSELKLTPDTAPVKKIGTSLPVTDEILEDEPTAESYIDGRLRLFVAMAEERDLLNGDGVNTVLGIYLAPGTGTLGQGSDTILDWLFKAAQKVFADAFVQATDVIIHPTDYATVRLSKDQNDNYLLPPIQSSAEVRPWGLRMVQTTAAIAGHPIVLNGAVAAQIFRRSDVSVQVGWIDDQFTHNLRTIVAEERLAFPIFRPAAIVKGDTTS